MSFPAYDEYKDSSVGWLGEIPSGWDVVALKYIVSLKSGDGITGESIEEAGEYPVYGGNGLRGYTDDFTHDGHYVVVGRQGALCGNINYANGRFWASEHAVVASPLKSMDTIWLGEMLRAMNLNQYSVSAAQPGLSMELVGNLRTVVPPLDEQQAISSFLDVETSKIDGLVSEQRRLIDLLKEKRQAVISHAVTKGLNPNAPMKPSGIQWLGDVPEHWQVASLKHYVSTVNGFGFSSTDFQDDGVPFIRAGNIKNKSIRPPTIFLPEEVVAKYERVILGAGDIVISMVGSDPKVIESAVGQVGIVPEHLAGAVPNQNVVIMRENCDFILSRYLFYTLCGTAYRNHLNVFSHKLANQSIISSSLLVAAKFTFPNKQEQQTIVDALDESVGSSNQLLAEAERAIELLQERRTALISAAVTGKIDVRGFAPKENVA